MRNSSQTTVVRIHGVDMNRGNVDVREYVDSLLSSVHFYQSRFMRLFALVCARLGITPRSLALVPIQSKPATRPTGVWLVPASLR